MSNPQTLPQDILTDILTRLPVKSLCQFKCVSPSWNSLISSPYFVKTHLNRAKTKNPKYPDQNIILRSSSRNLYSVDFADANPTATKLDFPALEQHTAIDWVIVWSSCDGLLLVSSLDYSYFLLNPSTRECKKLPRPPFLLDLKNLCLRRTYCYGICYDPSTDDYKVVMLRSVRDETSVAVCSLKTGVWRELPRCFTFALRSTGGGVLLNGCLHCVSLSTGSHRIVAFDLLDEIFREVPVPAWLDGLFFSNFNLAVLEDCLCLVSDCGQLTVWMMKEYGVRESWTKFTTDKTELMMSRRIFLCSLAEDKILWNLGPLEIEKLVVYNPKIDTLRDMVVRGIPNGIRSWNTYVESLVSPNHRGETGRQ